MEIRISIAIENLLIEDTALPYLEVPSDIRCYYQLEATGIKWVTPLIVVPRDIRSCRQSEVKHKK